MRSAIVRVLRGGHLHLWRMPGAGFMARCMISWIFDAVLSELEAHSLKMWEEGRGMGNEV